MRMVTAAVVLMACGGSQHPAAPAGIIVLDVGAEPRQLVELHPVLHAPERVELTYKMRMAAAYTDTVLAAHHNSVDLPSYDLLERLEATEIAADGSTSIAASFYGARALDDIVDPRVRRFAERAASNMRGKQWAWRLAPDGRTGADTSSPLAGTFDASRWITTPLFPAQPIGPGARWQETTEQTAAGVKWQLTFTMTLRELTANTATVEIQVSGHAYSQALRVEPNASTRLKSGTVTGDSIVTIPLRGLAATIDGTLTSEVNLAIVRRHERLTATTTEELIIASKPLASELDVNR